MTQLLNRDNTDGHCAIGKPVVSGNQNLQKSRTHTARSDC